jgi:hypothetical protein
MAVEDHGPASDLPQRLVRTIEDWGRAAKGHDPGQLTDLAVDALLKTTAMICLYRELSRSGLSPETVQVCYRTLLKEEPVSADSEDVVLQWRARKELFLRDLRRCLRNW